MVLIAEFALICLTANVYFEARGEPIAGQMAVAHVTMTRAKQQRTSICHQTLKHKQFSWANGKTRTRDRVILAAFDAPKDRKAWRTAKKIATRVLAGSWDNTGGATHFHEKQVKPRWRLRMQQTAVIGNHIFYKEK